MLRPISQLYTERSDDGKRKPKKINNEQHICILNGREKFRLVSPIFRKNIYVGEFEALGPDESPVDFFEPEFRKFPFAQNVNFIEVTLQAGDCMYVPAYFYVQSQSLPDKQQL